MDNQKEGEGSSGPTAEPAEPAPRPQHLSVMPTLVFAGEGFFNPDDGMIHSFTLGDAGLSSGPVTKQGGTFPMWLTTGADKKILYTVDSPDDEGEGSGKPPPNPLISRPSFPADCL